MSLGYPKIYDVSGEKFYPTSRIYWVCHFFYVLKVKSLLFIADDNGPIPKQAIFELPQCHITFHFVGVCL